MSALDGANKYYKAAGIRGVAAMTTYRLCGRPREITLRDNELQHPVYVRVGTTDVSIYNALLDGGEYAFELPVAPKIIVDAGANIGMASIYFARRYPGARILAIEAEADNFRMLQRNVASYPCVFPIHAALWNTDGEITIGLPDSASGQDGEWGYVAGECGALVRAITMATLMREYGIDRIDLLKVDIEGAEKEVFERPSFLGRVQYLMIETHDRFKAGCAAAVRNAVVSAPILSRNETDIYLCANQSYGNVA